MEQAGFSSRKKVRPGVLVAVVLIHVALIYGIIRAFTPDLPAQVVESVLSAFSVTVSTPEPEPDPPPPPPQARQEPEGAAAPAGKQARPREVVAPEPRVAISQERAPTVASDGNANRSGAAAAGTGTGAGGEGQGTGAGNSGTGQGAGGGATKAVKIAGDINSTRDYPRSSRELRRNDHVIVALTIGTDGRVKGCRVHKASADPEADRITCQLATQRFRFEPARDANGNPVQSTYGWQQRWFDPRDG